MSQTKVGNDLPDRVIVHWNRRGEILPEVLGMRQDLLEELVDGIHVDHQGLIKELGKLLR